MFPGYGYTAQVASEGRSLTLGDADYEYFHKLYLLTRTAMPRPLVRAIGNSRLFRRFPALLDPLLPKELPSFFLLDENDRRGDEILDLGHAQAVKPGGTLDRGLPAAS